MLIQREIVVLTSWLEIVLEYRIIFRQKIQMVNCICIYEQTVDFYLNFIFVVLAFY